MRSVLSLELKMNGGKKGEPYLYPYSFIQLLGYMRVYFHLPSRQTEGVVRVHASKKVPIILTVQ
ncbi:MAG: transposase [Candidatus Nitrosopolaris sp.]